ncbi:uncharacterized protein K489DRAFT_27692 [Dissoconium aciculare CBS 342.82]|uniref:Zn(2)-C6 fungal-type domain-containing protein n=1 Tax=Dissoconium aciculare CBS 342.82 TaxID=1314786 RepID=A0A6J3MIP7_9PEZI|nr:uncharacterized protein K489DRAFT_27692 [Dissoconium aciculare CBS 342.82]KAF1827783.1 hypothetical protein K489DRAFT_27692 [Dissoconium aciculare CBS 342.82]
MKIEQFQMREIAISQSPETTVTSAYPSSAESIGTPSSSQEASPALATDHRLSPYASPTTLPASTTMPRRLTEDKATKLGYVRAKMACTYCRRRKVRCLKLPENPTCLRCSESGQKCEFVPVSNDQAAIAPRRPRRTRNARDGERPSVRTGRSRRPPAILPESRSRPANDEAASGTFQDMSRLDLTHGDHTDQHAIQNVYPLQENYIYSQPPPSGSYDNLHDASGHGYSNASHQFTHPMTGYGQEAHVAGHLPISYHGFQYPSAHWSQDLVPVPYTPASVGGDLQRLSAQASSLYVPMDLSNPGPLVQDYDIPDAPSTHSRQERHLAAQNYPSSRVNTRGRRIHQ